MRRLGRWTLNGLTGLSLLLCVATVVLWVRSYYRSDEIYRITPPHRRSLISTHGELLALSITYQPVDKAELDSPPEWGTNFSERDSLAEWDLYLRRLAGLRAYWHHAGFLWFSADGGYFDEHFSVPTDGARIIGIPHWLVVVMTSLLPAVRVRRAVRQRRQQVFGRCSVCNYDLTGNVSGVCPECGTSVAKVG